MLESEDNNTMRRVSHCLEVALVIAGAWNTTWAISQEPIRIASRWELLIDNYSIERIQGDIELRMHEPVPQEVVLVHDKPWEGNSCGYHTIFQDGPNPVRHGVCEENVDKSKG